MKNKTYFVSFLFLIISSCNNHNVKESTKPIVNNNDSLKSISLPLVDTTKEKRKAVSGVGFKYENDTLLQSVIINHISKSEIHFVLTSFNKVKTKTSMLEGVAESKPDQDPEMDEDEDGNAYPSIQYNYDKDSCLVGLRVAMNTNDKVQIFEYNCTKLHDAVCPFGSVGVLKKFKK